jgi:predicted CXXCH cytochrome family protein
MRILKTLAAVALALPVAASAGIADTKHNLAANSTNTIKASAAGDTDTCKFCHVPHNAQSTNTLWNHAPPGVIDTTAYSWGGLTVTSGGTTLPSGAKDATLLGNGTRRCLSCHDGSTALGDLIAGATMAVTGAGTTADNRLNTGSKIGPNFNGTHPIGIPYAGRTGGIQSDHILFAYHAATNTGCETSTGLCVDTVGGRNLPLYGAFATASVECSTCHEPHTSTNVRFLRISNAGGALCTSCHNK